jgi:hypothetical protein
MWSYRTRSCSCLARAAAIVRSKVEEASLGGGAETVRWDGPDPIQLQTLKLDWIARDTGHGGCGCVTHDRCVGPSVLKGLSLAREGARNAGRCECVCLLPFSGRYQRGRSAARGEKRGWPSRDEFPHEPQTHRRTHYGPVAAPLADRQGATELYARRARAQPLSVSSSGADRPAAHYHASSHCAGSVRSPRYASAQPPPPRHNLSVHS